MCNSKSRTFEGRSPFEDECTSSKAALRSVGGAGVGGFSSVLLLGGDDIVGPIR